MDKRILMITEWSNLASGYSTYTSELLKRLTNKYEVAELACYMNDGQIAQHRGNWKVYPNIPADPNSDYGTSVGHQFGEYRINEVLLDFKPDICFDIRDRWMTTAAENSPFRDIYKLVLMPTVDGIPQQDEWLASYEKADAVLCYTDWGVEQLRRENPHINVVGSAPPGVDFETFCIRNRKDSLEKFGIDPSTIIVGSVNRNQPRKLWPNLLESFKLYLNKVGKKLSKQSMLWLHTSFPDKGWPLNKLIRDSGISHKILITYSCRDQKCGCVCPLLFSDAVAVCPSCNQLSLAPINLHHGVSREALAQIMSCFSVYVQPSTNEGYGMGQADAGALGLYVLAPDYSAMSDVARKLGGYPIKTYPLQYRHDLGTKYAIFENESLADGLIEYFNLDINERRKKAFETRQATINYYNWDKTCEKWMGVFDEMPKANWNAPPKQLVPEPIPETFSDNWEMVNHLIKYYLKMPKLIGSYKALEWIKNLNWGIDLTSGKSNYHNEDAYISNISTYKSYTVDDLVAEMDGIRNNFNYWEARRTSA